MFSILGKQKNQKDVNLQNQNQTEIASICTYIPLYCLHRTFAVQRSEVVVWDWLKWWVENGTKVTGAKNRAQKWNARHKKAYRNPQRFRPKNILCLNVQIWKNQIKTCHRKWILKLRIFYLLLFIKSQKLQHWFSNKSLYRQIEKKKVYVGWCPRVVYLLALYKQ